MYNQFENDYVDGDIVWVKLGSSWWPGQVVGLDKLPEDIQIEFQKKPLIAAVKFFQEESFEFVKNCQQIYKYNCTQKEEFIKKGLDKFRIRSKDHLNYMAKFPNDVRTAEILTQGNPDILLSERFNPEKKPDVSKLFGEKKIIKKKRQEEITRKSNNLLKHKVTHPRFVKENDHEIRIRQQPVNQLSTSNLPRGIYPCELCGFTATRVNVIICHLKSHRFNNKIKVTKISESSESNLQQTEVPKKKYVRKSMASKNKKEVCSTLGKRKQPKSMGNVSKKKKSDPELRDKLLADWNVDSDEDNITDFTKPIEVNNFLNERQSFESATNNILQSKTEYGNTEVLQESTKLLKETDNLSKFFILQNSSQCPDIADNKEDKAELLHNMSPVKSNKDSFVQNQNQRSRLSCFDFEEEDVSETSISNVKKISRNHKNMPIKKEIIKEFELSQSLKENNERSVTDKVNMDKLNVKCLINKKSEIISENKDQDTKNSTKLPETLETQVEILEIVEIQKESEEKLVKSEITESTLSIHLKKEDTQKFKNKNGPFFKVDNSKKFLVSNCEKGNNTINKTATEIFSRDICIKNNCDSIKGNGSGCNNDPEKKRPLTSKTADSYHILTQFDEVQLKNKFFPPVSYMIDEKTNSDKSIKMLNLASSDQDDSNPTIRKQHGTPKMYSKYENSDSVQSCCYSNQKISPSENNPFSTSLENSNCSLEQKKDENLSKTIQVFDKVGSTIEKGQNASTPMLEKFQKQSVLDHMNAMAQKLMNNDFHNVLHSPETIDNEKNIENKGANSFMNESDNYAKEIEIINKETSKTIQDNIPDSLPSETFQMKQLNLTSTEITEKTVNKIESDMSTRANESNVNLENISSKSNDISLLVLEVDNTVGGIQNDAKKENEIIAEMLIEGSKEKPSPIKLEKAATCLKDNGCTFNAQESTGNIDLDRANTICAIKPFDNVSNLQTNFALQCQEVKSLNNIEVAVDGKKNKPGNLSMNDDINKQSLLGHNNCQKTKLNSMFDAEKSLLMSNAHVKQSTNSEFSTLSPMLGDQAVVPVKKREKPRIIENVALKEPMILKKKLIEKQLYKTRKNKFETGNHNSHEMHSDSKAIVNKVDSLKLHVKSESSVQGINKSFDTTDTVEKFQTVENSLVSQQKNVKDEPSIPFLCEVTKSTHKHNSNNLDNTELDIDSMPFVLSEDMLSPESIEHIPVVMSTASFTAPIKLKDNMRISTNDSTEIALSLKKKSGTPTILKSKSKVKPKITSIKTIIPASSTAAHKGVYKVNTHRLKSSIEDQNFFGKYVIVQTSGNQEAYNINKKMTIPACKDSGNAQIVQQGGKVVILTSPQSGSPGQLPFNSTKALNTTKTNKITVAKQTQQINKSLNFCVGGSKVIPVSITTTENCNLPSGVSKMTANKTTQQMVASKSVLMQCSNVNKSKTPNTSSQSIISKSSIFAEIIASSSLNKSDVSSRSFSPKNVDTSKDMLSQMNHTFTNKTIIPSQGLISKGTVLTPITGSQVKALAAKNSKANKKQWQSSAPAVNNSGSNIFSNIVPSEQNTNEHTIAHDKGLVEQVIDPVKVKTSSQSSSNLHKKSIILSNQEQSLANKNSASFSYISKQNLLIEKNNEKVYNELFINSDAVKFEQSIDEKLDPLLLVKESSTTNKNLKKERKTDFKNEASSSLFDDLSATTDMIKELSDSTDSEKISSENVLHKSLNLAENIEQLDMKKSMISNEENVRNQKPLSETQVVVVPTETNCDSDTYVLVTVDEEGNIIPLDNNALVSIDTNSLDESKNVNEIVLQIENESLTNLKAIKSAEHSHLRVNKTFQESSIAPGANHDILAAALANSDFQQEIRMGNISLPMNNFTQTSLINQTILQSTIIPPAEPISSPLVLETSLTLNQPIMTPLEIPSKLSSQSELAIPANKPELNLNMLDANDESSIKMIKKSMLNSEGKMEALSQNKVTPNRKFYTDSLYCPLKQSVSCKPDQHITTPLVPVTDDAYIICQKANYSDSSTNAKDMGNNTLKSNEDPKNTNDINDTQAFSALQNIELEKSKIIDNDTEDTQDASSENNLLNIDDAHHSLECIDKIGSNHSSCMKQIGEKIEQKTEKVPTKTCTKIDVTVMSSEDLNSSCDKVGVNLDYLEMNFSNKNDVNKLIAAHTNQSCQYKQQLNQEKEEQSKSIIHEQGLNHRNENNLNFCQINCKENQKEITLEPCNQSTKPIQDEVGSPKKSGSRIKHLDVQESRDCIKHDFIETDDRFSTQDVATKHCEKLNTNRCLAFNEINANNSVSTALSFTKEITTSIENSNFADNSKASFSTQNFGLHKLENSLLSLNTGVESDQEDASSLSRANEISADVICAASALNSNSGLNEDETASSSYVPETPENQERDQDQESAVSTSSYEILPCEELNIASSNITPDTSLHGEFSNIDNSSIIDLPDISDMTDLRTSSYGLVTDSRVVGVELTPMSNFNDRVVTEQNVSTSYELPIPIVSLKESTPASTMNVTSNIDSHKVTMVIPKVSQCHINPNEKQTISSFTETESVAEHYESKMNSETRSDYYSRDCKAKLTSNSKRSVLQNVATSNVYQKTAIFDKQCLQKDPESNPLCMDSYSANYVSINSPCLERHDIGEIPDSTKPADR